MMDNGRTSTTMGERFYPLYALRCLLLAIFASAVLEEIL